MSIILSPDKHGRHVYNIWFKSLKICFTGTNSPKVLNHDFGVTFTFNGDAKFAFICKKATWERFQENLKDFGIIKGVYIQSTK